MENKRFILWVCITFLFMAFIYSMSAMPYKEQDFKPKLQERIKLNSTSLPRIEFIYDNSRVSSSKPYEFIEFIIRKLGHVVQYALLTSLWLRALSYTRLTFHYQVLIAFVLSLSYAFFDEYHQKSVEGRTGHLIDVLVPDFAGIVFTLVLYTIVRILSWRRRHSTHS